VKVERIIAQVGRASKTGVSHTASATGARRIGAQRARGPARECPLPCPWLARRRAPRHTRCNFKTTRLSRCGSTVSPTRSPSTRASRCLICCASGCGSPAQRRLQLRRMRRLHGARWTCVAARASGAGL